MSCRHFAFGDDVRGIGQHFHHAHVADRNHHLECAGIQKIADQHRAGLPKWALAVRAAAPQVGFVDDIVVEQRCGVDELDDGRQFVVNCGPR
jgi:hypothetical protein